MADVLVQVRGLKKYFPIRGGLLRREVGAVRAVDGIDFEVRRGETVGLVGESGCGKTTAGRTLLGLTAMTAGTVVYRFPSISAKEAELYRPIRQGVRPLGVTVFAAVLVLGGLASLVVGTLLATVAYHAHILPDSFVTPFGLYALYPQWFGAYMAVGGALSAFLGGALWDLRRWAPPALTLLLGAFLFLNVLGYPGGVVLAVIDIPFIAFLSRPSVKGALRSSRRSAAPANPGPDPAAIEDGGIDIAKLAPEAMRNLRHRMQIVFQDPFSSMNPRMLVKDIVGEPLKVHSLERWFCPRCRTSPLMESKSIQLSRTYLDPKAPPGSCEICGGALVWTKRGFTGREIRSRVTTLLSRVGLNPEHLFRFPHEFSGGQRQRIGIARALALNPEFIVLDEPTSALDVSVQAQILNLLKDLQQELGLTYLFISHHLAVIYHICNRVNVMYVGEIVESAPTETLFREPLHPYTKALLSAIPVADPDTKMSRMVLPGDVPSPANPPAGCRFHPRCPVAFEICGWTADEVIEALDRLFKEAAKEGAREPELVQRVEIDDPAVFRLVGAPGSGPALQEFIRGLVGRRAEGARPLKAIASVEAVGGDAVAVRLHAGRVPVLRPTAEDHIVACHLY